MVMLANAFTGLYKKRTNNICFGLLENNVCFFEHHYNANDHHDVYILKLHLTRHR